MRDDLQVPAPAISNEHVLRSLKQAADRIQDLEARQKEAIAIVGLACRFPGSAADGDSFWELLRSGRDAVSVVPADRWPFANYKGKEPGEAGKIASRDGGFLTDVDRFDARFFGISGREAIDMDPQQRIALECAWEAFENAGTDWRALKASRTGIFMGATTNDYARLCLSRMGIEDIEAHFATGNALNSIAGRIAYTLGLEGPCLTIDTACSSSLAAVHLACRSLRNRECDVALAGGVNLLLMPEASIATSRARMLSPDGRCKTFDSSADGYVRSEGCGTVVLMRISDATREKRRIYASVLGSAINQNGESSGLTVPSRRAQEKLIRDALADASVAAGDIDYVEAHGTGTSLGDPIELNGLKDAYGQAPRAYPLLVGSVKSNIGHTESAAGIAGLIKATLALWHGELPPSIHCENPTPHFPWAESGIRVCTELTAWPHGNERRAAVSSFGASGSNAHVILGGRPVEDPQPPASAGPFLLALSARSPRALRETAERASDYLLQSSDHFPDVCRAVNVRRQWASRLVVLADSCAEAGEALQRFCAGKDDPRILAAPPTPGQAKRKRLRVLIDDAAEPDSIAVRDLYEKHEAFRDALVQLDDELGRASLWLSDLRAGSLPSGPADPTARFVLSVAEARFWQSWGLTPDELVASEQGLRGAAYLSHAVDLPWVKSSLDGTWLEAGRPHVPIIPQDDEASASPQRTSSLYSAAAGLPPGRAAPDDRIMVRLGVGAWRTAAAEAFVGGFDLSWSGLYPRYEVAPPSFPTSVFERESFWPADHKPARSAAPEPFLVDRHVEIPSLGATVVETDLDGATRPVFREHLVFGRIVVAGACHLSLMLEASARRWPGRRLILNGLQFDRPLVLGGSHQPTIQVLLGAAAGSGTLKALSFDQPGGERICHATATAAAYDLPQSNPSPEIVSGFAATCPNEVPASAFYEQLQRKTQIEHGPAFRWIHGLWVGENRAIGRLKAPPSATVGPILDPGLIDSCFQMIAAAAGDRSDGTFVPFSIGSVSVLPGTVTGDLTAIAEIEPAGGRPNLVRGQVRLLDADGRLVAAFEDLEFRKASPELLLRDLTDQVGPDLYTLSWSAKAGEAGEPKVCDTLLVTSDADFAPEICDALKPGLADRAEILAPPAASRDELTLAEADRRTLRARLTASAEQDRLLRILYMPRLAAEAEDLHHPEAALLDIVQEVARARCPVELVVVTTNAIPLPGTDDPVNPHESGLWGFAAVVSREQAQLGLRILDVDRDAPAGAVAGVVMRSGPGDRLLIRDGIRYEASVSLGSAENGELALRADRSYLVTGAFGGIGMLVAADLVARGARHLVLAGRRSDTGEAIAFAESLERQGATIVRRSVDIANRTAVRDLIEDVNANGPPLDGLVHAAAVLDDAMVVDATRDQLRRVTDPKAVGAWNLHRETERLDLSFFVLLSSASALIGTPGQAAYAAANASLDGIASLRRSLGRPASTIVWGPWADVGMTSRLNERQRGLLSKAGIGLIRPEEGMQAFGRVALQPNIMVIKAVSPAAIRNALTAMPSRRPTASGTSSGAAVPGAAPDQANLPEAVIEIAAEALRVPADSIALSDSLSGLGVDSLIGMEIATSIADRFGVDLPLEDLMADTTLEKIAGAVRDRLPMVEARKPAARSPLESVGLDELADSIAAMSDEEIAALLPQLSKN